MASSSLTIADPAGELGLAEVESAVGGARIQYGALSRPGVYHLTADGESVGRFAANVDPRESDLGLPPMGLADAPVRPLSSSDLSSAARPTGAGSELWMACLKAVLVLMLAEVLLVLLFEAREKRSRVLDT